MTFALVLNVHCPDLEMSELTWQVISPTHSIYGVEWERGIAVNIAFKIGKNGRGLAPPPGYTFSEVQRQLSNVRFHSGTQADRLVSTWAWLSLRRKSKGHDGHTVTLKVLPGHTLMTAIHILLS